MPAVSLEASVAAARIRANPRFSEFIRVEVPSTGRGPTIDALAAAGFIARSGGEKTPYALTEAGKAAGFESFEFQSGIPVFQVPVGGRRVESVLSIEPAGSSRDALATFTYRHVASPVGEELLRRGARLEGFDAPEPRTGHAVLSSTDRGWRVVSVDL